MTATVTARLGGADEALLTVVGEIDGVAELRIAALARAARAAGARRMILDLTSVPEIPLGIHGLLSALDAELRACGGWLLVDGAGVADNDLLAEVFLAYRSECPSVEQARC